MTSLHFWVDPDRVQTSKSSKNLDPERKTSIKDYTLVHDSNEVMKSLNFSWLTHEQFRIRIEKTDSEPMSESTLGAFVPCSSILLAETLYWAAPSAKERKRNEQFMMHQNSD